MVERGSGSVINVASIAGLGATPTLAYYGAAKAAVINLTKTIAVEWGSRGVRANAIAPGWIKTDLNKALWGDPAISASMIERQPIHRWGEVEDLIGGALWLASDASSFVTGTTLVIDGGQTLT
jgi:NAD(P)-dependent dehydrogenase (short-subunit alcohol dehydrogenase family)